MTELGAQVRSDMRQAYDAAGATWGTGPDRVYLRLAQALVNRAGADLHGLLALDAGAGTGVAGRVLRERGARPVSVDLSIEMLRTLRRRGGMPPAWSAVGDLVRMPLRTATIDLAVAAFVLNHVPDPPAAMAELGRVTRPGGVVLTSTFTDTPTHPAKAAVDAVAERFGFRRPAWYDEFKRDIEPRTARQESLRAAAAAAGLTQVDVREVVVEVADLTPAELAAWRLGMAHLAAFVTALGAAERARLADAAIAAVTGLPLPPVRMLTLFAIVH
jgi:ubiquinone/menaquinone biosynthesis C-methylase UbiE